MQHPHLCQRSRARLTWSCVGGHVLAMVCAVHVPPDLETLVPLLYGRQTQFHTNENTHERHRRDRSNQGFTTRIWSRSWKQFASAEPLRCPIKVCHTGDTCFCFLTVHIGQCSACQDLVVSLNQGIPKGNQRGIGRRMGRYVNEAQTLPQLPPRTVVCQA